MRFRYNTLRCALFLGTAPLAACGTSPGHMAVGWQWNKTISDFGFTPLYPPQEDVQPGDVYLVGTDGPGTKPPDWKIRVSSLDSHLDQNGLRSAKGALAETYARRLTFKPMVLPSQDTPPKDPKAVANATPPVANDTASTTTLAVTSVAAPAAKSRAAKPPVYDIGSLDDQNTPLRMHKLALPELQIARYTAADLTANSPLGSMWQAMFGISDMSQASVDITLDKLEELHIPESDMLRMIRKHRSRFLAEHLTPSDIVSLIANRGAADVRAVCETDFRKLDDDGISLLVVNQVIYAHSINYNFGSTSSVAGRLGAQLTAAATPALDLVPPAPQNPPDKSVPAITTLTAQVSGLMTALHGMTSGSTPSVSVNFGIGRSGNLSLINTSAQPLAIGFGGNLQYTIGELMNAERLEIALPNGPGHETVEDADGHASPPRDILRADARDSVAATCRFHGADGTALVNFLQDLDRAPKTPSKGLTPFKRAQS
jgi:hypothetical protein